VINDYYLDYSSILEELSEAFEREVAYLPFRPTPLFLEILLHQLHTVAGHHLHLKKIIRLNKVA